MNKVAPITLEQLLDRLPAGTTNEIIQQIRQAYALAEEQHNGRRRPTGELYVEHDLSVANVLCRLGLNDHTLIAALLHDILTTGDDITEETLYHQFGPKVTSLVIGFNNLLQYAEEKDHIAHARTASAPKLETIRRAILALIEQDVRIILLRLADVLQELRKASNLSRDKQKELAHEVMNIYAPLANRLGIWQLKWELEDLAFRYLETEQYNYIAKRLDEERADRTEKINDAIEKLHSKIEEMGFSAIVTGRPKHIYSIYRKMERKGVDFDQIYDVHALRVILHTNHASSAEQKNRKQRQEEARSLCYQVLGAVHSLWQPIPHEFDDYIASPKPNGYKSLHTAVMDEDGQTLEIQIRTDEMNKEAELGIAAHWAYKEENGNPSASDVRRIHWFRQLVKNLRDADAEEDADDLQQEFLDERIYVFTPRGDVVDLPAGSTPVDFAYQIHTEVGHRCRGAQVNGKMVSLDYQLRSGDRVKIITASRGGPSRDWMNENLGYTGSARTRSKIRSWFRRQEKEQNIEHGREVVKRELKRLGLNDTYTIGDIAEALRFDDVDQFLAQVGFGDIQSAQIGGAIASLQQRLKPDDELRPLLRQPEESRASTGLTVLGVGGLHTKFAGCCNPIPPEPIKGYITRGKGITVHSAGCKTLKHISERERLIDVEWGTEEETYPIPVIVRAYHRPGLIEDISNVLKGRKINAPKTKRTTANSITTVYMLAEVSDLAELEWLLERLDKLPNVFDVRRQRWN